MAGIVGQKTYSHLSNLKHIPGHYEISTTSLLYHVERGFSINLDAKDWQTKYLYESPLDCKELNDFVDPRKAFYGRYCEEQREKDVYVQKIFEKIEESSCLKDLNADLFTAFEKIVPPLRYVFQCLQMQTSYLGQMSPSSRIMIPFLLQAADEIRRIQTVSYLMGLFRRHNPQFGDDAQSVWEEDAVWQPLRQILEQMLVTYDFGEALVLMTRVVKPAIDAHLMPAITHVCTAHDAPLIAELFTAMGDDCLWHRQWSDALMERLAMSKNNHAWIESQQARWGSSVNDAIGLIINDGLVVRKGRA